MAQSTTRNACAGAITAMYAGTALWAYYDRDRAFWTFAFVAGSIALPFVVAQLLKRVVYGLVTGAVLTAISIAFPPFAVVAALIGTLMLCAKFVRFARTLPFLLNGLRRVRVPLVRPRPPGPPPRRPRRRSDPPPRRRRGGRRPPYRPARRSDGIF